LEKTAGVELVGGGPHRAASGALWPGPAGVCLRNKLGAGTGRICGWTVPGRGAGITGGGGTKLYRGCPVGGGGRAGGGEPHALIGGLLPPGPAISAA